MAATASQTNLAGLPRRLVQDGIVAADTLAEAVDAARKEKVTLIAYLVSAELADARAIAIAASHEFGVPLLDLDAIEVDLDVVRAVDQKLLNKHRVLPLVQRGQRLFLGIADPTNLQAIDDIKFQTSLKIDPVVVEQDKLEDRIAKALEAVDTSMQGLADDDFDLENLEVTGEEEEDDDIHREDVDDAPVVRFVNKILLDAIKRGASDIHFEPYEKYFRIRTRLDGVLSEVAQPPVVLANKVCARLTLFGEKIVLRILDPSSAKLGIDALGYEQKQKELYLKHLNKPYGMILVTGPTGSGKTVSLYTGLNILNTPERNTDRMKRDLLRPLPELEVAEPGDFGAVPGRGVRATVGERAVVVGSRRLLQESGVDVSDLEAEARTEEEAARTPLWVAVDGEVAGLVSVADAVKEGSAEAVAELRAQGLRVVMLTGDNRATAEAIAAEVGIDEVRAEVLPDQKADVVRKLQEEGAVVGMVGDGINDAPALAQADVGMAIGTGADVAMETADVTLMRGDLRSVPRALALSRATMRTIRQNLFWAFFYNVILIPVAAGALYPFAGLPMMLRSLHPILAALAMAFSSVSVVGNSLRLRRVEI